MERTETEMETEWRCEEDTRQTQVSPFCVEERGKAWKEGHLLTLIMSDFCNTSSSPLLYTNRSVGKDLEGRASPTLGSCLLHSQCRFIQKLTQNITVLHTCAQMFSQPCG